MWNLKKKINNNNKSRNKIREYLEACIITSLNLYEFSQINNNEMGVLVSREEDTAVYQDAYAEAQRIIRISDEVKISLDVVDKDRPVGEPAQTVDDKVYDMLTTSKLAEKLGISTVQCNQKLNEKGWQTSDGKFYHLTDEGRKAGATVKKGRYGFFIVWPADLDSLLSDRPESGENV